MEDKDRFIDELLNSALAHRQRAAPRAGLEARVLEHVRASASGRSGRTTLWKLWVAATATAAAVVIIAAIHVANRSHSPAIQTSQVSNAVPAPPSTQRPIASSETTPKPNATTIVLSTKRTARLERRRSHPIEPARWPPQFPSPAPLSREEEALVRYVQDTPPQSLAASLFKERSEDQPMEIRPLKIAPLEIQPLASGATREEIQKPAI